VRNDQCHIIIFLIAIDLELHLLFTRISEDRNYPFHDARDGLMLKVDAIILRVL
jgi:hypothetical protein